MGAGSSKQRLGDRVIAAQKKLEAIKKERSRWMQKIIALHKTTGR